MILKEKVLMGGEESGGIAVHSHIPERDGIWMGLLLWQFMVETGKPIRDLIEEIYSITGPFAFERSDLAIERNKKNTIIEKCRSGHYGTFGERKVIRVEDMDGYKFYFNEDEWLMIRASGTEPLLRTYAESHNKESALAILNDARETIMAD